MNEIIEQDIELTYPRSVIRVYNCNGLDNTCVKYFGVSNEFDEEVCAYYLYAGHCGQSNLVSN